jgi:alkylation response protein AidB-like acyl-CoA dehydrogenase
MYRRAARGEAGRTADLRTLRERVAQAHIESEVFAAHTLRILPRLAAGDAGTEAALQKLFGSEVQQRACELAMQLEGPYAQLGIGEGHGVDNGEWQERYLYSRSITISSGTSEVLRSLLAQQALGLPR